jgi:uncharacterized protein (DUF1697 family)
MPTYIALLRAVNVGGTGKLPMAELKAMCVAQGFTKVQTYIASGNVVFAAKQPASKVKALLEGRLHAYARKPIGVIVRTADEMMSVLKSNPFPKAPPNRTVAIFLDDAPPTNTLTTLQGQKDEEVRLGKREIPSGSFIEGGRSQCDPHLERGTSETQEPCSSKVAPS